MVQYYPQQTLAKKLTCSGIGVHSGKKATITIHPAPENHGIRFKRVDLPGTPDIPALFKMVVDTSLATVLGNQGAIVSTIEHLMATFAGLGIDNALVEIDGYEMPIMDGSARIFTEQLIQAGVEPQNKPRWFFVATQPLKITEGDKYVSIEPAPGLTISCSITFDSPLIGTQERTFNLSSQAFRKEISPARTFGFTQDLVYLKQFSLGRGGSLDNAVVIDNDNDKILNAGGLRFPDEFVRHKLLDCLGDFSLLGMPIQGHIITRKSGHALNHAFIKKFLKTTGAWETRPVEMAAVP
ncbi:MAG: UDP-3-O-acyl-N-acetylglucosamine deacetylase [Desulfobacterium sp.]